MRSAGRLKNPWIFTAVALLGASLGITLIPTFPLLLLYVRHNERAVPLEVRLCRACEQELHVTERRTRRAYLAASALPPAVFLAFGLASLFGGPPASLQAFLAAELSSLVVATLGIVAVRRRERRERPYVLDFDGTAWRVELPATWAEALRSDAPDAIASPRQSLLPRSP